MKMETKAEASFPKLDRDDKRLLERQAAQRVFGDIPNGDSYLALWDEFEAGLSTC